MSSEKYITTQNDIDLLMRQLVISEEHSKILMTKHRGDLKKAIVDACKLQDGNEKVLYEKSDWEMTLNNDTLGIEDETDTKRSLEKVRVIADEKDAILSDIKPSVYDTSDLQDYEYIAFTQETQDFIKKKNTVNRRQITDFFTDYLKDNYSVGEDIKKPTIKFLGGNSKCLYKKWSLHNPAMFYFSTQVISIDDKEASGRNKVASLILQKAGHLSEDMCLVGPCVVANNWF
jgi:hypothetical protein